MSPAPLFVPNTAQSESLFLPSSTKYSKAPTTEDHELPATSEQDNDGDTPQHPQQSHRRWTSILPVQLLCLAWLVPVGYLLKLNFESYIVGASAWCPRHDCWVDAFNSDTGVPQANVAKFAAQDHDLTNVLQYIAKLLEVWFGAIAGAFMYLLVMHAAGSQHALPLRLLTLASEFPDLLNAFDRLLWGALPRLDSYSKRRFWVALAVCAVVMGVLSNLMGPALATLLIPSLKWVETEEVAQMQFGNVLSADIPGSASNFTLNDSGCSIEEFQAANYSCAIKWATALDGFVGSRMGALGQVPSTYDILGDKVTSQQGNLQLYFNTTSVGWQGTRHWIPSRQLLHQFDEDRSNLVDLSHGVPVSDADVPKDVGETFVQCNNSLQVELRRRGPVLTTSIGVWGGNISAIPVDQDRIVYCFPGYVLAVPISTDNVQNFTRCIQRGHGWHANTTNQFGEFEIEPAGNLSGGAYSSNIHVEVTSSNRVVYLPNGSLEALNMSASLPEQCFQTTGQLAPDTLRCDWDYFFSPQYNKYSTLDVTTDANTIMFSQNDMADDGRSLRVVAVEFVVKHGFTTYSLDPWPMKNPLALVQMPYLQSQVWKVLPLDPTWTFAAWAVNWKDGVVPGNRTVAQLLFAGFENQQTGGVIAGYDFNTTVNALASVLILPILQTLSLVEWDTETLDNSSNELQQTNSEHPPLALNARIYVWAYGFDSKTARLGATVAIAGCLVAILQFLGGLVVHRRRRTLTQMLVAALAHDPHDDFAGVGSTESAQARVRFQVKDAEGELGGLRFRRCRP